MQDPPSTPSASLPQSCPGPPHSQPGTLAAGSSLTALPQLAISSVHGRHWYRSVPIPRQPARKWRGGRDGRQPQSQSEAPQAADFRPAGPRRATQRRAPPLAFPRPRVWRPALTLKGNAGPPGEAARAAKRSGLGAARRSRQARCAGASVLGGKDVRTGVGALGR